MGARALKYRIARDGRGVSCVAAPAELRAYKGFAVALPIASSSLSFSKVLHETLCGLELVFDVEGVKSIPPKVDSPEFSKAFLERHPRDRKCSKAW